MLVSNINKYVIRTVSKLEFRKLWCCYLNACINSTDFALNSRLFYIPWIHTLRLKTSQRINHLMDWFNWRRLSVGRSTLTKSNGIERESKRSTRNTQTERTENNRQKWSIFVAPGVFYRIEHRPPYFPNAGNLALKAMGAGKSYGYTQGLLNEPPIEILMPITFFHVLQTHIRVNAPNKLKSFFSAC